MKKPALSGRRDLDDRLRCLDPADVASGLHRSAVGNQPLNEQRGLAVQIRLFDDEGLHRLLVDRSFRPAATMSPGWGRTVASSGWEVGIMASFAATRAEAK